MSKKNEELKEQMWKSNKIIIELKTKWCEMAIEKEKLDIVILLPHYQHVFYNYKQKAYYIPLKYNMYLKIWKEKDDTICYYIDTYDVLVTNMVVQLINSFLPSYEDRKFSINDYIFILGNTTSDDTLKGIIYFENLQYTFAHVLGMIYENDNLDEVLKFLLSLK